MKKPLKLHRYTAIAFLIWGCNTIHRPINNLVNSYLQGINYK